MRFEKHCWAEIDLDALLANYDLIRRNVGGNVCAVLKADAYGHGSVAVAEALHKAGISAFAVSCLAEARHLRRHGLTEPLLILGYTNPAFADELANLDITQALFSSEYAEALSQAAAAAGCTVRCHLKADTGMGRIGFNLRTDFEEAMAEMETCYSLPGLAITGIFQHFAVADSHERGRHRLHRKPARAVCPGGGAAPGRRFRHRYRPLRQQRSPASPPRVAAQSGAGGHHPVRSRPQRRGGQCGTAPRP